MTSLRHNSEDLQRSAPDLYLDAARDCILDVGWRRTTLTEVARRAGVSRMTIYRTWSDMPQLLGDLMTREWGGLVEDVADAYSGDMLARTRGGVVGLVKRLRGNELFVRIVELDPELILPYLFARRGRSQDAILAVLATSIESGQQQGTVRAGSPTLLARTVLLAAHGFVLSAQTMVDDEVSEADLDAELGRLVEKVLAR